jgi:hypothetical protein
LTESAPESNRRAGVRDRIATPARKVYGNRLLTVGNVVGRWVSDCDLRESPRQLLVNVDITTILYRSHDLDAPGIGGDSTQAPDCG